MRTTVLALSLVVIAGRGAAADVVFHDVRATVGMVTGETKTPSIDFYDGGEGRGINVIADPDRTRLRAGPRVGVTFVQPFDKLGPQGGVIVGLGYVYQHQTSPSVEHDAAWVDSGGALINAAFRDGPIKADINAFDLHVGYAYALTRRIEAEVIAFGGIGSMMMSDDGPFLGGTTTGEPIDKTNGPYREGGVRVGLWYRGKSGGLIGLEGGWLMSHGRSALRYETSNLAGDTIARDVVYTIDYRGPIADLSFGWTF